MNCKQFYRFSKKIFQQKCCIFAFLKPYLYLLHKNTPVHKFSYFLHNLSTSGFLIPDYFSHSVSLQWFLSISPGFYYPLAPILMKSSLSHSVFISLSPTLSIFPLSPYRYPFLYQLCQLYVLLSISYRCF